MFAEWVMLYIPEWIYVSVGRKFYQCDMLRLFKYASDNKICLRNDTTEQGVLVEEQIPQFNFGVFNKVLGMMAYWDAKKVPYYLDITSTAEHFDVIKSFFEINEKYAEIPSDKYDLGDESIWNGDYLNVFDPVQRKIAYGLYKRYFRLTKDFREYVNEDLKLIKEKKVLGVLMRGTDYSKKKPKGHPIQPGKEQILEDIKRILKKRKYKYIYLATDEEKNEHYLRKELSMCKILVNRRMYLDSFVRMIIRKSHIYQVVGMKEKMNAC